MYKTFEIIQVDSYVWKLFISKTESKKPKNVAGIFWVMQFDLTDQNMPVAERIMFLSDTEKFKTM